MNNDRFWDKGPNTMAVFGVGNAGRLTMQRTRAGETSIATAAANDGFVKPDQWQGWAFRFDSADSQILRIFAMPLGGVLAEVTYASTSNGAGAFDSDAGSGFVIGNRSSDARNIQGAIGYTQVEAASMSLFEMQKVLRDALLWPPPLRSTTRLLTYPGAQGQAVVLDYSGRGIHGVVTSAVPFGIPLPTRHAWAPGIKPLLLQSYTLTADAGTYVLTGTAVTLKAARTLALAAGSYALTGTAAALSKGFRLSADAGTYAVTGQTATLSAARLLSAEAGVYTLTGSAATLTKGFILTAQGGSYALSGTAASLLYGRAPIAANAGSYVVTGSALTLNKGFTIGLNAGTYALTGGTVNLLSQRKVTADAGSYAWSGAAVNLLSGRRLTSGAGAYAWTGTLATLKAQRKVSAGLGAYTWTGMDAALQYSAAVGQVSTIDLSGSSQMTLSLSGTYSPSLSKSGSYQPSVDVSGTVE
jgi:hypothetical protein